MISPAKIQKRCWICESTDLKRIRESQLPPVVSGENFRITDSCYGVTAAIDQCGACGFCQCTDMVDVLLYYNDMSDDGYEASRAERALQERALLSAILKHAGAGRRLLDVGAGSGILVEEAQKLGLQAEGVEPSLALQKHAVELGLPVRHGVLPHPEMTGPFDVVTLVDVIEHVPDPVDLLFQLRKIVADDGVVAVVTPDRGSVMARIMGYRWWHYRIAHIGYFDRANLLAAIDKAGFDLVAFRRPTWYFPLAYVLERLMLYVPTRLRFRVPEFTRRITIPLNLFDSTTVICRPRL